MTKQLEPKAPVTFNNDPEKVIGQVEEVRVEDDGLVVTVTIFPRKEESTKETE